MYKEPKKNRIYQIKKQFELEVYIFNENPLVDWKNLAFTFYFFSCLLIQFFATLDPLTWFKNWRGLIIVILIKKFSTDVWQKKKDFGR